MDNGCKERYVPVHLHQEMATVVPPCLQGTTYRVPEKVEKVIQRMYKVPMNAMNLIADIFLTSLCNTKFFIKVIYTPLLTIVEIKKAKP